MCGRFALKTTAQAIREQFLVEQGLHELEPHYNIAPSMGIASVRMAENKKTRVLTLMQWGLIPAWAKDPAIAHKMINARAETVAEKPSFRGPFRHHRCLIPADGFYEWKKLDGGGKQPYFVKRLDEKPFALAGLWSLWTPPDGSELESCTIITTNANELMEEIHDRMPVILKEKDFSAWLDPDNQNPKVLKEFLKPYPAEEMEAYPVSTLVNKPQNDSPDCLKAV